MNVPVFEDKSDSVDFDGLFNIDNDQQLKEIEEESDNIDELISVSGVLGSIRKELSNAVPTGEMGIAAATALNVAVEALARHAGFKATRVFALESMHGKHSRRVAITAALENIADSIVYVIRKIKDFFKKIYDWFYESIEHAIRGAAGIKRRAANVLAMAIEKQSEKTTSITKPITKRNIRKFVNVAGKPMSYVEILKGYTEYNTKLNENFYSAVLQNALAKVVQSIQPKVNLSTFTEEDSEKASDEALQFFTAHAFTGFNHAVIENKNDKYSYTLPFDNAVLEIVIANSSGKKTSISSSFYHSEEKMPDTIQKLTPTEVIQLTRAIEAQMNNGLYKDYKSILADLRRVGKIIDNMCTHVISNNSPSTGAAPSLQFLKSLTTSMLLLTKNLYTYNGNTNRTLLALCEASL